MMKFLKHSGFAIIFIILATQGFCQNLNLTALKPELTKNSNAVLRLLELNYIVKDTGKSVATCHLILTVLNSNGNDFAEFEEYYDKFSKITELSGKIYNSFGILIKKLKASDFSDQSAVSNSSVFDDNRLKNYKPLVSTYPFTVEYEFTIINDGIINYPSWFPQASYNISVEKAIYNLTVPKNFNVRFKSLNNAKTPDISQNGPLKTYHLEIVDMPAIESEVLSSGLQDIVQAGYFIPEFFKIGGKTCKNDCWKNLGIFFNQLNNQPNQLSEKTITDLSNIKKKANSKRELTKLVYEYMQSKTRYVSIQLGMGGLQPFDASIVDKYGYGDCKALANYTKVLLKEVGVPSIYTLVKARKYAINIIADESFDQFNHAILCVPMTEDSIWLECTSQTIPFGFLGSFTDNRNVLLITDEGGILTKTKFYSQVNNQLTRTAEVIILKDGKAEAIIKTQYSGLQYDDNVSILYESPDNQKETLYGQIKLPTFVINNFKVSEIRHEIPELIMELNLTATKYATPMGNRLLLPLNILSRQTPINDLNKERKTKMWLRYGYIDSDSITYRIPEGYVIESIPQNTELQTEFGSYILKIASNNDLGTIRYIRILKMNNGIFPPEKFKEFTTFLKSISTYDNIKVSLIQRS